MRYPTRLFFALLAMAVCQVATAQVQNNSCIQCPSGDIKFEACDACCGGAWAADLEMTFHRIHRSDGFNRNDVFGFEAAPRFTVSYINCDGTGARIRYWSYDHAEANGLNGNLSSVDTYNLDVEYFRTLCFDDFTAEVSGGIRFHDYEDQNVGTASQPTSMDGFGALIGLRATQAIDCCSSLYARGQLSIIAGNARVGAQPIDFDVSRMQTEIGIGYQRNVCLMGMSGTVHAGAEYLQWEGYEDNADGSIGFAGFVFGFGTTY